MKITNANELTTELLSTFEGIRDGRIKPVVAVEMNNAAGKVIANIKNQLVYALQVGEEPNIPFLKGSTTGIPSAAKLVKGAVFEGKASLANEAA